MARLIDAMAVMNGLGRVAVAYSAELSQFVCELVVPMNQAHLGAGDEGRPVLDYCDEWETFSDKERRTSNFSQLSLLHKNQRLLHTISRSYCSVCVYSRSCGMKETNIRRCYLSSSSGDTVVDSVTTHKKESHTQQQKMLKKQARERVVPSTRFGRMATFGGLAAGLGIGTAAEMAKRAMGVSNSNQTMAKNPFYNDANLERIVSTLCRVRGAALKLGQMISLQDGALVPEPVQKVFDRVRNNADFMPLWQMEQVLEEDLGKNWRDLVKEFDNVPLAAASIGQVHRAVLHNNCEVAMKIQYPGVAESINSDIDNLSAILKMWDMLPQGLFLDSTIAVARKELAWETDYQREAQCSMRFKELLADDERFAVPSVVPELSTKRVLTASLIHGMPLDHCTHLPQHTKNEIARNMMDLCLKELFEFRFMQTDPNWSNFFYNVTENKVYLLDFGASRDYSKQFVDDYVRVIHAAVLGDRHQVVEASKALGYLTGYESKGLVKAHVDAVMILGEPFAQDRKFDFSCQDTTVRIHRLIPMLLEGRLSPPPDESYSLHRKMAGTFLLCAKLNAKINCYNTFQTAYKKYKF